MLRMRISLVTMLIALLLVSTFSFAATARKVNFSNTGNKAELVNNNDYGFDLQFKLQDYSLEEIQTKAGKFDQLSIDGFGFSNRIGEPKLPVYSRLISVPIGAKVEFEFVTKNQLTINKNDAKLLNRIIPAQASVSKSANPDFLPFEIKNDIYSRNEFADTNLFSVEELGIMRGVRVFRIIYEPIGYNPSSGEIKVCSNAYIKVNFAGANMAATKDMIAKTASWEFDKLYSQALFNWNDDTRTQLVRHPTKMVILCPTAYTSNIQTYVDWKTQQGFIVNVVTVGSGAMVANTTTAIKAYMQNLWDTATTANPAPTYLLIIGDESGTIAVAANTGATDSHVTDLTYVRLNGTDYMPEMYHGRFSVSSTTELANIISKTITYEKTLMPDLSYLGKTVLIAGVDSSFAPTHGNGAINYATTEYFNATHGITSNNYLYPASGSSSSSILANANEGRGFINYTAHGSQTSWADPSFTVSNVNSMTNTNKYGLMVGNCCITNEFDYSSPCFGEAIIRKANGGGVAYIGGINSTYWDEDYYWAVGYKTSINGTAPAYNASKLGAYDGLFHTHSEAYSNWVTTTGENVYMGNLAVQQSGSSLSDYYWEIYHIMGDPSLMTYLGVPTVNAATYPSTVLMGATSITVTAAPYSRVALTMGGVNYGTALVPAGGSLTLPITPFANTGTAQLVFTAQNKITRIESVTIAPNSGAYLGVAANTYNDTNNSVAEYNETGRYTTTFENIGSIASGTATATLNCATAGITITDGTESIASIAAGASVVKTNAFSFTVANNIVNQLSAAFTITMVSGSDTWTHNFNQVFNAPALSFGTMTISDPTGNGNGKLDPGETVTITMPLNNTGAAASPAGNATLSCATTGITVNTGTANYSAIAATGSTSLSFSITAASSVTIGTVASLVFNTTAGAYTANKTATSTVGIILEDFESGNFSAYPWVQGTTPWVTVNTGAYAGTYAAKSGTISNSSSTTMETTRILSTAGTLTFWYKVSSETNYDKLKFYIDGVLQGTGWSGTVDWTQASYPLTAGTRALKWEYMKDGSVDSGSDCAWIDNIVFPASTGPSSFNPPLNLAATSTHGSVTLTWTAPASGTPTGYKIYKNSNLLTTVTGLTYTDSAVVTGTTYSYYLKASYSGGDSDATSTVSATPTAAVPRNLTASASNLIVNLSWTAPVSGTPSSYKIYRNTSLLTTVTALSYSDTAVTNGTLYSYYVTAVYSSPTVESAASNTATATPNTVAPLNLTATPGNSVVNLSWTAATGRGEEKIDAKDTRTISGYKIYRNSVALTTVSGVTTYQNTGLTNGTSYSFYVTTVYTNPAGESAASNTATATPVAMTQVIIGTGTSSTGTSAASPVNVYYQSLHGQSVYTAAELNAAGIVGPINITQLGFNITGLPTKTMPSFVVRMKHTTATNVASWIDATSLATVYANVSYLPTTTGYNMYTLSTPFLWNGTDNIVIDTAFGLIGSWASAGTVEYTTVTNGYRYTRSDSADQTSVFSGSGTQNTTSTYRPNVKFAFAPATTNPQIGVTPTSLAYGDVAVGGNSVKSFTITNLGGGTLTGTITTPTGYSVVAASKNLREGLSFSLEASEARAYNLTFTPTATTAYNGNVVISSNSETMSTFNLAVTGAGYIPPTIAVDAVQLTANLMNGEESSDTFNISNTGSQALNYSIGLTEVRSRGIVIPASITREDTGKSIEGSTLVVDVEEYTPGTTEDWTFTVTNGSTDTEWLKDIYITFPTGVTVNSAANFVGGSGGDLVADNTSGNGITIDWFGESSSGYGLIHGAESASATVNVTVAAGLSADMNLAYTINGDVFGDEPHIITDAIILPASVPPLEWFSASPLSGTIAAGAYQTITGSFSAVGMAAGSYEALLTITSNDTVNPTKQVQILMDVAMGNRPPQISLPTSFTFEKNGSLVQSFSSYISDPDSDPITLTVTGNSNVTVDISGSSVTFGAAVNWCGTETITFTVDDGEYTANDNVDIIVTPTDMPVWEPVVYPTNPATVYAVVTIDNIPAQLNDMVAAFVGDECRATGEIVMIDRAVAYTTLVVNLADSEETVSFKIYAHATDTVYPVTETMPMVSGAVYGETTPVPLNGTLNVVIAQPMLAIERTKLSWSAVQHATNYQIWACSEPYGEYQLIGSTSLLEWSLTPNASMMFYHIIADNNAPTKGTK